MKIALTFIIVIGFISITCNGSALPSPVGATGIACTPHSAAVNKHLLTLCGTTCSTTDAEDLHTAVSIVYYCIYLADINIKL